MMAQNHGDGEVFNLVKYSPITGGIFSHTVGNVKAVDGVSFFVRHGETLGIVGESGCGKSTTGRVILRLLEPTSGRAFFGGEDVFALKGAAVRKLRRQMQIIFQDPYSSLNPRMTVGELVGEPLKVHGIMNQADRRVRVNELLKVVGLKDLQQELQLAYMFISHNLSVVKFISDRVGVMYLGKMVEMADTDALFAQPHHPYTISLLSAIPNMDPASKCEQIVLKGDVPSPMNVPSGCRFHTRCRYQFDRCGVEDPCIRDIGNAHFVACHLMDK